MNKSYRFAALLVLALCAQGRADWNSTIAASNPLNWYQFNELSGSTAIDHGSQHLDGTYGTGALDATRGVPGLVGTAVQFGNQSTVFLHAADVTGIWSAEFLLARTGTKRASVLIRGVPLTTPTTALNLEQFNNTGQIGFTQYAVANYTFTPGIFSPLNQFIDIVYVNRPGTGMSLYVNGVFVATSANTINLSRDQIGSWSDTIPETPLAIMDEAIIYNRALGGAEIASHFLATPEPSSLLLAALALLGLVAWRRRKRSFSLISSGPPQGRYAPKLLAGLVGLASTATAKLGPGHRCATTCLRRCLLCVALAMVSVPAAAATTYQVVTFPNGVISSGLVYSTATGKLYCTTEFTQFNPLSRSIYEIDPNTGAFSQLAALLGSPSDAVITPDGHTIYTMSLNSQFVQRFDALTHARTTFQLPPLPDAPTYTVADISPIPGRPDALLVGLELGAGSGLATYVLENGVFLPDHIGSAAARGPSIIAVDETGASGYGFNPATREQWSFAITPTGIQPNGQPTLDGVLAGTPIQNFQIGDGKLFTNLGDIYDLAQPAKLGGFYQGTGNHGAFTLDFENHRLFAAGNGALSILTAYHLDTLQLGAEQGLLPGTNDIDDLVRFGADGLAYADGSSNGVVIVRTTLIPEPSSILLAGLAFVGLLAYAWRGRQILACHAPRQPLGKFT